MPLVDACALVELYAEKGDRKYERATLKYLRRYLEETDPPRVEVAQVAAVLAERALLIRGFLARLASSMGMEPCCPFTPNEAAGPHP